MLASKVKSYCLRAAWDSNEWQNSRRTYLARWQAMRWRGMAQGLRQLFEIAATTLADDAGTSELAQRVTGHLGCELTAIVPVTERFPKWEHVNVQRGVDAYLAARQGEMAPGEPEWFGAPGAGVHPHENLLSLLS